MNGYRLKAFRVNHNVLCYGYTLEIDRAGRFDVERANAAGIPQRYWGILQKGGTVEDDGNLYTPDMVLGPARKGLKIAVTGRIQTGSYTNQEGQKVYTTDVVVEEQEFAESKAASDSYNNGGGFQQGADSYHNGGFQAAGKPAPNAAVGDGFMNIPDEIDEELPFN